MHGQLYVRHLRLILFVSECLSDKLVIDLQEVGCGGMDWIELA